MKDVLREFDPHLQSGGIDEAYLDVTDYMSKTDMTGPQVAETLRTRIREHKWKFQGLDEPLAGLTASCGIAANRRLAKICSDINKPDGQYVLPSNRADILQFVSTLPIRKVGGIGKVTERMLHEVLAHVNVCVCTYACVCVCDKRFSGHRQDCGEDAS